MLAEPVPVRPWLRTLAVSAVLFGVTVLLFSRSIGYDFSIYDDPSYVTNNPHVQAGFTAGSVSWAFIGRTDYWHPLTWLSHMLDWTLYRDNAAGHHLTGVLWHAANAVLAFLVLRRLTGAFWAPAFCAALFAWHPLRVESVIWVTERKDVMSGCFFLLTLWAYAGYASQRAAGRPVRGRYFATLALFLGSLMCKPMMVTLPAVLLLLDVWPLNRAKLEVADARAWRALLLEKLPFFALSVLIAIVTVLMQQDNGAFVLHLPIGARLGNAAVSVARYLVKFAWPANLAVFYPHPGHWPGVAVAGGVVAFGSITSAAWWLRRRAPWLLVGWGWFLVMLLPAVGILQVGYQAMADRYTYVPVLGLELAVVWSLRASPAWFARPWMPAAAAAILLGAAASRTWQQQATWRDSAVMWEHAVAVTGPNEFTLSYLGNTYLSLGRYADAVRESRAALQLNPRNEIARFTLANALDKSRDAEAAIAAYREYLQLRPDDASAEFPFALLLLRQGRRDEAARMLDAALHHNPNLRNANLQLATAAVAHGEMEVAAFLFAAAVRADPADGDAQFSLAMANLQLGRTGEALARMREAVRLRPENPDARTQLGMLLLGDREPAQAATEFRAALAVQPRLAVAWVGLGRANEQLGDAAASASAFQRAFETGPENPIACRAWAQALARRGQFREAVGAYEQAVKFDPKNAALLAELGFARWLSGQKEGAITAWKAAFALDPSIPGLRERLEQLELR